MKKVIFALPGREFSGRFLQSWTELVYACLQNGIQPIMSQHYSPLLYYVRNMCLGGDNLRGVDQKPFNGFDYDYIMWIDSDIVFKPEHFFKLMENDKDIVSGLYMMSDNTHYATIQDWDDDYFLKHGSFEFLNRETVAAKKGELFKADYTGFGWMLIKKGVFESLPYPWFQPLWVEYKVGDKTIRDFSMEDVSFCKMIKEKGYDVWIDPNIIVGHEKMMVL